MLRRLSILLALAFAASATPSYAAPTPPGQTGFVDFCKADVAANPQFKLGDCMAFVATLITGAPGLVPQVCDFVRAVDPDFFYASYDTYSECVRDGASEIW